MNLSRWGCLMTMALAVSGCVKDRPSAVPTTQVTIASINEHPVIGELGVPLGTVVAIDAKIIRVDESNRKGGQVECFLRVSQVNGQTLAEPRLMYFSTQNCGVMSMKLRDTLDLYTGNTAGIREEAMLARGANKNLRLLVYETGEYSGIPDLPPDVPQWQDHSFGFSTHLEIVGELRD